MLPEEILEKIFSDETTHQFDIYTQSTVIHAVERAIDDAGFKVVKSDMEPKVSE